MTYNFVDDANLECYRQSLRPKAGQLLRKLFEQLAQGRDRLDAARAFSQHSNLAYYSHLLEKEAAPSSARVLTEHVPWDAFFARQGPYGTGGEAALRAEMERVAARLLALIDGSPPAKEAAGEDAESLLARFDQIRVQAASPAATGSAVRDEL